jgi:extracellular elastinolytic metalloproteinase
MRLLFVFLLSLYAPQHSHARHSFSIPGGIQGAYDSVPDNSTLTTRSSLDPLTIAARHLRSISPGLDFKLNGDHYTDADTGVSHVFFTQTYRGLPIDNAVANINVLRDGRVLSVGSSFTTSLNEVGPRSAVIPPMEAVQGVVDTLGLPLTFSGATAIESKSNNGSYKVVGAEGALSHPRAELVYYRTGTGVRLAWKVETDIGDNWMVSYASAGEVGNIFGAVDYVADEKYEV